MRLNETSPIVMQAYGPEYAGENVAWINAQWTTDAEDFGVITAAVAKVGPQGASFTLHEKDDGTQLHSSTSGLGFESFYQVDVTYEQESGKAVDAYGYKHDRPTLYGEKQPFPPSLNRHTWDAIGGRSAGTSAWASGSEIIPALKQTLETERMPLAFGPVYYRLAITASDEVRLADPAMAAETVRKLGVARNVSHLLRSEIETDDVLLHVLRDSKPSQLQRIADDLFTENRRQAHTTERKIFEDVDQSVFANMRLYAPTGNGRAGRTWPFMDAGTSDEAKAFGPELRELQNGNVGNVLQQLESERKELVGRLALADEIRISLSALAKLEKGI